IWRRPPGATGLREECGPFLRRASFPAVLAVTLVVLAMLPALGSFRLASRIETAALLRRGQLDLARVLRERRPRIRRELSLLPEATATNLLSRRLTETLDRCDVAFFTTPPSKGPLAASQTNSDWFAQLYRTIRLRADDTAVKTGGLLPIRASDGSWQ